MSATLKWKIALALVLAAGTAFSDARSYDFTYINWPRVLVISLIGSALLLLIPNRWLEKKKGEGS